MQSLAKAMEPSGWMMCSVLAQSHPWTNVPSMDGASITVGIMKMREWCVEVGRFEVYMVLVCIASFCVHLLFSYAVCALVCCVLHCTCTWMCTCTVNVEVRGGGMGTSVMAAMYTHVCVV